MAKVLGIDLGTTNSCVAVMEAGEPEVLENSEGGRTSPSVVAINPKSGERYVGQLAKRQAITNPENTLFSIKRFMGRRFTEVQNETNLVPYQIAEATNGDIQVKMTDKLHSPPEIAAMILQKLKADAENKLGGNITQAVITVPAYFNDAQRQATKDAGTIAGLEVLRIVNEPTAAALAYGIGKKNDETIAVYDLGGGTFDISILQISEGVFEVKATNGDTHLGGDDFDDKIISWICDEFRRDQAIDLHQDRMALQRLKEAAEKAKIELSSVVQTEINLPFITADASGPKHLNITLTRAKLEQLVGDLLNRTNTPVQQCLKDAGLKPADIDEIILVGGQTRMPAVVQQVQDVFGKEPHKGVNPDEVVAMGAAIQAGVLQGEVRDVLLLDVTPLTLGIETKGRVMTPLIERNTTIPTSKSEVFSTAEDSQSSVEIHILQGERSMATENKSLGQFILEGILPSPRGIPQIEVAFDIDANGILNVSAKDKGTGKEQTITITASSGLAKEEVEKMMRDAEQHAEEDRTHREDIELRNQADSLVYSAEKMFRENSEKIPDDLKEEIEPKIANLKTTLQGSDSSALRPAMDDLSQSLQKIGEAVYSNQQDSTTESESGKAEANSESENGNEDGTVEGEFREV
jgi:molecular chaperone DnaK